MKEFVRPPFVRCPDCGTASSFGVLMICDGHYVRRCIQCWFDQSVTLPRIQKRVIYLDQFVISNMMKELDPDRPASAKGQLDGFYLRLFETLDRLSKLQLIVCPHSPLHENESVVDPRYEKIRAVFRQMSHGIGFRAPETLRHAQIERAFDFWISGQPGEVEVSRNFALTKNPDVWQERFRVELNYRLSGLAAELTANSAATTAKLRVVCEDWCRDPNFSFQRVFEDEVTAHGQNIVDQCIHYTRRLAAVQLGQVPLTDDLCFSPPSIDLVTRMLNRLSTTTPEIEKRLGRVGEFFRSKQFRSVPSVRISGLFWATIAREINSGRSPDRFPKAGMFNDIDAVAAYSPFCDAMFVDKEIGHFASQRELQNEMNGKARIFSLRKESKNAFLDYLALIESGTSAEHLRVVNEVYGHGCATPFVELLSHR